MEPLDSLKWTVAKLDDVIGWATEASPTPAVQAAMDQIRRAAHVELERWCTSIDRKFYSDGRPMFTELELEPGQFFRVLWPVVASQLPGDPLDVNLPSGRIATVTFSHPVTMTYEYSGWWKVDTDA